MPFAFKFATVIVLLAAAAVVIMSSSSFALTMKEDVPVSHHRQQVEQVEQEREEQINLPGGYSAIPDATDEHAMNAALYAVRALRSLDEPVFSFQPALRRLADGNGGSNVTVTIARGYRQVVAGMNYKLVIVLLTNSTTASTSGAAAAADSQDIEVYSENSIVGCFGVTIYDRFGELSVTKWGKEVPPDDAKALLENLHNFGITDLDGDSL